MSCQKATTKAKAALVATGLDRVSSCVPSCLGKSHWLTTAPLGRVAFVTDRWLLLAQLKAFLSHRQEQRQLLALGAHFQNPLPFVSYQLPGQLVKLSTQRLNGTPVGTLQAAILLSSIRTVHQATLRWQRTRRSLPACRTATALSHSQASILCASSPTRRAGCGDRSLRLDKGRCRCANKCACRGDLLFTLLDESKRPPSLPLRSLREIRD